MIPTHAALPVEKLVVTDPRPEWRGSIVYRREFLRYIEGQLAAEARARATAHYYDDVLR